MTTIEDVLDVAGDYFDCGVNEGRERREVDTPDGIAQKTLGKLRAAIEQYAAERDALQAKLDAAVLAEREDADRYRLLRRGQHWSVIDGVGDVLRAERLDAAIDAIHAEPEQHP